MAEIEFQSRLISFMEKKKHFPREHNLLFPYPQP